jgi:hypothetical protein
MNEPKKETPIRSTLPRGIGAQAAKKRQELKEFDEDHKKQQEKYRDVRKEMARDVAEADGRDRRRLRTAETKAQNRLKFILGALALAVLREKDLAAFSMTAKDLDRLKPAERQLIDQALDTARPSLSPAVAPASAAGEMPVDGVDLAL